METCGTENINYWKKESIYYSEVNVAFDSW